MSFYDSRSMISNRQVNKRVPNRMKAPNLILRWRNLRSVKIDDNGLRAKSWGDREKDPGAIFYGVRSFT